MNLDPLRAVIFDVDGTLAETERDGHRVSFNRAFGHHGLSDRWDEEMYGQLLAITGGRQRIRHYLEQRRGVPAENAEELATLIHRTKTSIFTKIVRADSIPPRPGVPRFLDDLALRGLELAVATTGSRDWVVPFLDNVLAHTSSSRFDPVITGDDVLRLKPDPEAFHLALTRLGCDPGAALVVEDSRNGVVAAKRAGLTVIAVKGDYSEVAELADADLVVDSFGEQGNPFSVLVNPYEIDVGPVLDTRTLIRLHARARPSAGKHDDRAHDAL